MGGTTVSFFGMCVAAAVSGIDSLDPDIRTAMIECLERDGFVSPESPAYGPCKHRALIHDDGYVLDTVSEMLKLRGVRIKPLLVD